MEKPGSREAIKLGCLCAIWDNHYGRGYGGNGEKYGWITELRCPIHGEGTAWWSGGVVVEQEEPPPQLTIVDRTAEERKPFTVVIKPQREI